MDFVMHKTDYLAKTAGQAFVVCNEPDGSNELLLTDRLKQLVSDSDKLSVRKMFGEQEDMSSTNPPPMNRGFVFSITYKTVLLCNTPPCLSTLDAAIKERLQFIPNGVPLIRKEPNPEKQTPAEILSTFEDESKVSTSEEKRFQDRRFLARRDITEHKAQELGRRLMFILYTNYVRRRMYHPSYALEPPARIEIEKTIQLQELTNVSMSFRRWEFFFTFFLEALFLEAPNLRKDLETGRFSQMAGRLSTSHHHVIWKICVSQHTSGLAFRVPRDSKMYRNLAA